VNLALEATMTFGYYDRLRFHQAVLGSGALPMTLLEQRNNQFVAEEKKR
jgi:uncharacterized protein (DUF885 family)